MAQSLSNEIQQNLGLPVTHIMPLIGGMVGQVYQADLADGSRVVVKTGTPEAQLDIEGYMLRYLTTYSNLPVPEVLFSSASCLIMTWMPGESYLGPAEHLHAADFLADLHNVTQAQFGLELDTLIGSLSQPNLLTSSWLTFFCDQRLQHMATLAHRYGTLPSDMRNRIEKLSAQLSRWLDEPEAPALLHGDIWTNNVLAHNGRITAFIDPAIYYGHPEIELAFIALFNTFGNNATAPFFQRYNEHRPIAPGFFEERQHLYNLYPLLVHVRLFGGPYISAVNAILERFGF